jgi:hypothetical protein
MDSCMQSGCKLFACSSDRALQGAPVWSHLAWGLYWRKDGGSIEVMGRRGRRRCKQLLDELKEKRGYWKLKEEALDRTLWGTRFGRVYGPVVRRTAEWMNEWMNEWMTGKGRLQAGRCDWIPDSWTGEFPLLQSIQTDAGAHKSSRRKDTGDCPQGLSDGYFKVNIHPSLAPRLRMIGPSFSSSMWSHGAYRRFAFTWRTWGKTQRTWG